MLILLFDCLNIIEEVNLIVMIVMVGVGVILLLLYDVVDVENLIFLLMFGVWGLVMIGGVLFINVGGFNVLCYGNMCDLCLGVEVVLVDGWIMNLMFELYKDNFGLNFKYFFIGVEGIFGVIICVVMKLFFKLMVYVIVLVLVLLIDDGLYLL